MSWRDVQHHYIERDDTECPHGVLGHVACPECELANLPTAYKRVDAECQQYHDLLKAIVESFDAQNWIESRFFEYITQARQVVREGFHAAE